MIPRGGDVAASRARRDFKELPYRVRFPESPGRRKRETEHAPLYKQLRKPARSEKTYAAWQLQTAWELEERAGWEKERKRFATSFDCRAPFLSRAIQRCSLLYLRRRHTYYRRICMTKKNFRGERRSAQARVVCQIAFTRDAPNDPPREKF